MTETPEEAGQPRTATSVGQTGGLPGANAVPEASQLSEDEMADTVSGLGPGDSGPTPGDDAAAGEGGTSAASNG